MQRDQSIFAERVAYVRMSNEKDLSGRIGDLIHFNVDQATGPTYPNRCD